MNGSLTLFADCLPSALARVPPNKGWREGGMQGPPENEGPHVRVLRISSPLRVRCLRSLSLSKGSMQNLILCARLIVASNELQRLRNGKTTPGGNVLDIEHDEERSWNMARSKAVGGEPELIVLGAFLTFHSVLFRVGLVRSCTLFLGTRSTGARQGIHADLLCRFGNRSGRHNIEAVRGAANRVE